MDKDIIIDENKKPYFSADVFDRELDRLSKIIRETYMLSALAVVMSLVGVAIALLC